MKTCRKKIKGVLFLIIISIGLVIGFIGRQSSVYAANVCPGNAQCQGSVEKNLMGGCEWNDPPGACQATNWSRVTINCDLNCKYSYEQWECIGSAGNCYPRVTTVSGDCCEGGGYSGTDCPTGEVLSCPDAPYLCQTYCTFPDQWVFVNGLRVECGHTSAGATKYYCRNCVCVAPPTPSCTLSLTPVAATILKGNSLAFTASVSNIQNGSVSRVTFTSIPDSVVSVSPAQDGNSPYLTTATGVNYGTATITASGYMSGEVRCTDTSVITVPCTATAPSGISIDHSPSYPWNQPMISWTPGTGGTKQQVFISKNRDDLVAADYDDLCPVMEGDAGPGCLVAARNLGTSVSSYQNPAWKPLSANTNYYWRVVNWKDVDCSAASGIFPALSSCTVTVQKPDPFFVDNQGTVSVNLLGDISGALEVKYKSNDSSIVSVDPETYQKPSPFSAVLWAKKAGWSSINAQTRFNGTRLDVQCTSELFEVKDTTGWWQVKDSDVTTNSGLFPRIPDASTLYFNLEGTGGFPGVSMYGGSTDLKKETVAVNKKWLANASSSVLSKYNYAFFRNLVDDWWPARQNMVIDRVTAPLYFKTGGDTGAGYHLFYHQGDLSIEVDQDLGWQKSILFVDGGNLTINAKINLGDGHGFFMAIVGKSGTGTGGNIIINPSVQGTVTEVPILPELEGFFLADGTISTGSNGKNQDNPLHIRGAMAGLGSVNLQRSMSKAANQNYPSEYLEYAPDLVMLYPFQLTTKKTRWKEVAP